MSNERGEERSRGCPHLIIEEETEMTSWSFIEKHHEGSVLRRVEKRPICLLSGRGLGLFKEYCLAQLEEYDKESPSGVGEFISILET